MEHRQEALSIRLLRYFLACALIGACVSFIWFHSFQPPEVSAGYSKRVAAVLGRVSGRVFGAESQMTHFLTFNVRKIAHAVEFAVLGGTCVLTLWILGWISGHTIVHAASLVLLVAVMDETIQLYSFRGSSVADVVLDLLGGLGGIILALAFRWLMRALFRPARRHG